MHLLYLEDVQAYSATFVDVWVIDWCGEPSHQYFQWGALTESRSNVGQTIWLYCEPHLRRLKWVPLRNRDLQLEKTTLKSKMPVWEGCIYLLPHLIRRALGTHQGCLQPFLGVAHLQINSRLRWHLRPRAPASRRLQVVDFSPTFPTLCSTWQPSCLQLWNCNSQAFTERAIVYFRKSSVRLFSQDYCTDTFALHASIIFSTDVGSFQISLR